MIEAAQGCWRPFLIVAAFTGLRASELRGLRWSDIDVRARHLTVRQRADAWGTMGHPKTHKSERTIPLGPFVVNTLKEWRLACAKSKCNLVFPGDDGEVESHDNILRRGYWPTQIAAGVTTVSKAKYTAFMR